MNTTTPDIRQYLRPVLGTQPWRVKPGVGSFLTLEFGPRVKTNGHLHGQWHLWIYLANWTLFHGDRRLVDSDADRRLIAISVRRLEHASLSDVVLEHRTRKTTFSFDDFRLVVSPADYLERPDERDEYWMFFMPNNEVLAVGPSGARVIQADAVEGMNSLEAGEGKPYSRKFRMPTKDD